MRKARWVVVLSVIITLSATYPTGRAAERESPYGHGPVKLVSTEWLQNHLKDPNLAIVDSQADVYDYFEQHIPGAVHFGDQTLRAPEQGMPVRYLAPEAMELLLRRLGLNNDGPVVVYTGKGKLTGTGDGLAQTMVAYTLARFGQNNIYVLDGGETARHEGISENERGQLQGYPPGLLPEHGRVQEAQRPGQRHCARCPFHQGV